MLGSTIINDNTIDDGGSHDPQRTAAGAVCLKAVLSGALCASAISLLLLLLGLGLGLSPNFPWTFQSLALTATTALIWVGFTQLAGSSFGGFISGYLAGNRASPNRAGACFRFAIQGLLAWSISTLLSVSAIFWIGGLITNGLLEASKIGSTLTGTAAIGKSLTFPKISIDENSVNYFSDMLMRSEQGSNRDKESDGFRKEIGRILNENADSEEMDSDDRAYLAKMLAKSQKMSQSEAEKKVDDAFKDFKKLLSDAQAKAKHVVEESRRFLSKAALWICTVFSLGMISSILMSIYGGRRQAAQL